MNQAHETPRQTADRSLRPVYKRTEVAVLTDGPITLSDNHNGFISDTRPIYFWGDNDFSVADRGAI